MSTRRSNTSAPRNSVDYASDRSPLQKVETIVNGMREDMSKEEKRARAIEAEQRLSSARTGKAPAEHRGSRSSRYDDGARYDDNYYPPPVTSQPAPTKPTRGNSTRTEYRDEPRDNRYSSGDISAKQARADLYNGGAPASGYTPVRNDSRRRSDGTQPRVLTKPPSADVRAVSENYNQPPARQRSVREGRVFDTDPGYVDRYEEPTTYVGRKLEEEGMRQSVDYGDTRDSPGTSQAPTGMRGRVLSIFKRRRNSEVPAQPQPEPQSPASQHDHHHYDWHGHHEDARRYQPQRYKDYRKDIRTASIGAAEPVPASPAVQSQENRAWWEKSGGGAAAASSTAKRRTSGSAAPETQQRPVDGTHETSKAPQPGQQTYFQPQLYLKCGPLLRFTGIRKSTRTPGQDVWTGSVMVVTVDSKSRYEKPPNLRIFKQPIALLPPPPRHIDEASGQQLPPEYVDPLAGQVKMSRVGMTLYVKPVEALEEKKDLSRVEDDSGLFEVFKSQPYQLPSGKGTTGGLRAVGQDGELRGKFQDIPAYVLHKERGVTFWKWNLEIELGDRQVRLAYRINQGPPIGFWVPAKTETMNMMFHSCNGFSLSVDTNDFSGPDPLWRDVLNAHQTRPFHLMIGGGDQVYMDAATTQTRYFGEWSRNKNAHYKHNAPFTAEMQDELEKFYLNRYSMWFSQGLFGMANSQIPMVNVWDDHDIIDGFGSYPHHTMASPVMSGIGNVAFKYYMLFQHQSLPIEDETTEPSWLLGAQPGEYITELSRSLFMWLGKSTALLGLDCRTERMRDEIMTQDTWDIVFSRLRKEIVQGGEAKHLIVILGVPIAYPRLNFLENVLTSRVMDPVKALGRTGALGGFVNKFDGGVEILDDLNDHWTAKHHKGERNWFIQELQEFAAETSVRITILSGDVHLGAVGRFFSNQALGLPKDQDHRYMPNVISSAIVNTPPADMVADVLNKRNKIHHLDEDTDEDMVPMFPVDVNDKSRNNKMLLPRRNWCSIREYKPEQTPPATPSPPGTPGDDYKQRPGVARRLSLSRRSSLPGAGLIRRLSQRGDRNTISHPPMAYPQRMNDASYFDRRRSSDMPRRASSDMARGQQPSASDGDVPRAANGRPNPFLRRPTVHLPNNPTHMINLRGGLDIRMNFENERGDPAGTTTEYRLIVPALDYRGDGDPNPEAMKPKGRLSKWFGGAGAKPAHMADNRSIDSWEGTPNQHNNRPYDSNDSIQPEPAPTQPPRRQHSRHDSVDVPTNVPIGSNGMPIRKRPTKPTAEDTYLPPSPPPKDPAPPAVQIGSNGMPIRKRPTKTSTDDAYLPPERTQSQRDYERRQAPRPDPGPMPAVHPNTGPIPVNLPGPPPGPPPSSSSVARGSGGGSQRYASAPVRQGSGSAGAKDGRRASADVRRDGREASYM